VKFLLALTAVLAISVLLTAAAGTPAASYIDHDLVGFRLANGGQMVKASGYSVSGSHRDKPGQVEVHEKETDIFYVTDGQATFLTGGTMVGGKLTSPNQHLGSDTLGGETHYLSKGDVIVIPAGTAHWFKDVPDHVNYFVVKVIQPCSCVCPGAARYLCS
jgi:mannose-6-phosphate isomerase-like protein (cupin superfamily)